MAAASGEGLSPFAARLTDLADTEREALCQAIVGKALEGERWAVELVVRYVFARQDEGPDPLTVLLEDLRERLAQGA